MARGSRNGLVADGGERASVLVADSTTELDRSALGRAVVCGSHGGRFAAALALRVGVGAIVLNDAAIGKDRAGVSGLDLLDEHHVPAATIDYLSADIGNGGDALRRGVLSHVNSAAGAIGCVPGMPTRVAAELMAASPRTGAPTRTAAPSQPRHLLRRAHPRVWALDSASLATEEDAGHVLLTGSHGLLLGGASGVALRIDPLAAVFNDAGRPDVPSGRLAALDERGMAAATVDAQSARIGDGRSTYFDGVLSAVNGAAASMGAKPGMTARGFTELVLAGGVSADGQLG